MNDLRSDLSSEAGMEEGGRKRRSLTTQLQQQRMLTGLCSHACLTLPTNSLISAHVQTFMHANTFSFHGKIILKHYKTIT